MRKSTKKITFCIFLAIFISFNVSFTFFSSYFIKTSPKNTFDMDDLKSSEGEITIKTPENKTYTEPDSGYFPAALGFENQLSGVMPKDWIIHQSSGAGYLRTIDELDGHKKVLDFYSGSNVDYCYYKKSLIKDVAIGSIEYWFQTTDVYPSPWYIYFMLSDGLTLANRHIALHIVNGSLTFHNGTDYILVDFINPNQWYHVRVDFNMITDTSTIYLNNALKLSNVDNYGVGSKINAIHITNHLDVSNTHTYVDAIGYSWDSNYNIGNNLNEGLLLSYDNSTTLDWQGYSLDGQTNKTILGNTTIPMPADGLHNIQVFGNVSVGTMYDSGVSYFTIIIQDPPIPPPLPLPLPPQIPYLIPMILTSIGVGIIAVLGITLIVSRRKKFSRTSSTIITYKKPQLEEKVATLRDQFNFCPICGTPINKTYKFCVNCGISLKNI